MFKFYFYDETENFKFLTLTLNNNCTACKKLLGQLLGLPRSGCSLRAELISL
jgi:hypothetical protein